MMSLYSENDGLMCKVFPSSLEPTTIRWLNGLRKGFIHNLGELMQAFGVTLRSYADRYWELHNEI